MKKTILIQTTKYVIVGVMNTTVTLVVIWIILRLAFGVSGVEKATIIENSVANIIGFSAGLINSFFFNRRWTFRSKRNWRPELAKFTLVFMICYVPQLFLVNILNSINLNMLSFVLFGHVFNFNFSFICQIIGNIFYTTMNFICNKYYTFRK
ncbi:MAG: GtrA family protein [Dysgonamonadaceae bacterium]|jgi:putative flippase GtrA|nr:GtrA family protein [Dysgonamonadaceae bacterium]